MKNCEKYASEIAMAMGDSCHAYWMPVFLHDYVDENICRNECGECLWKIYKWLLQEADNEKDSRR